LAGTAHADDGEHRGCDRKPVIHNDRGAAANGNWWIFSTVQLCALSNFATGHIHDCLDLFLVQTKGRVRLWARFLNRGFGRSSHGELRLRVRHSGCGRDTDPSSDEQFLKRIGREDASAGQGIDQQVRYIPEADERGREACSGVVFAPDD